MQLRPATPLDKPAIIELLKQSLGESMIPKSTSLWEWKHEENPFGNSYVLVAEENGELIGVRAFMQWNWLKNGKQFRAIRAVDTATHPGHQGKGIFKKLTLRQLELCEQDGVDFVFNTPNEQSRPGYLKMGWQQQGKMPLKLSVRRPIQVGFNVLLKRKIKPIELPQSENWSKVLPLVQSYQPATTSKFQTNVTEAYIRWRYAVNPLFNYGFISDYQNYLLIYRPKDHSKYQELRLTDFILFKDNPSVRRDIRSQLGKVAKELGADIISISGNQFEHHRKYFDWMGPIPVKPWGPIVTVRQVNKQLDMNELLNAGNWQYSLGDMELF